MNIAVRYYTRSGNTERLAGAVAEAAGVKAAPIAEPLPEKADILFLGCSYYAFDVDDAVKAFIHDNRDLIGKLVCVGTSAMMRSIKKPVAKVAAAVGVAVADEEFHCRGQFGGIHKGRPDTDDLQAARTFTTEVLKKEERNA